MKSINYVKKKWLYLKEWHVELDDMLDKSLYQLLTSRKANDSIYLGCNCLCSKQLIFAIRGVRRFKGTQTSGNLSYPIGWWEYQHDGLAHLIVVHPYDDQTSRPFILVSFYNQTFSLFLFSFSPLFQSNKCKNRWVDYQGYADYDEWV